MLISVSDVTLFFPDCFEEELTAKINSIKDKIGYYIEYEDIIIFSSAVCILCYSLEDKDILSLKKDIDRLMSIYSDNMLVYGYMYDAIVEINAEISIRFKKYI